MCEPSITNFVMSRKYAQNGLEGLFKHAKLVNTADFRNLQNLQNVRYSAVAR